jgi:hypothetical protein
MPAPSQSNQNLTLNTPFVAALLPIAVVPVRGASMKESGALEVDYAVNGRARR